MSRNSSTLDISEPFDHSSLVRVQTCSSISTNATAHNLVGPGRNVGLLFDWLGAHLEALMNRRATRLGLGPDAVVEAIRLLLRHRETTFTERHRLPLKPSTAVEAKKLKKLCKKLLRYARFVPISVFTSLVLFFLKVKAS